MQLRLDAADRLVELVEERRGPLPAEDAARALFALPRVPAGMARGLLDGVVRADARLAWAGDAVALAGGAHDELPLEQASFVVFDLETTGLSPASARICEIGAVRVRALAVEAELQTLVDPRMPIGPQIAALTGLRDEDLRRAPAAPEAVRLFLEFAGDAVLVAHNARFDVSFLDREVERLTGRRVAAPVIDTVALARRLLAGRVTRFSLGSLACFFGVSVEPCHRALPDAQATAEVLLALVGLAQERGAQSVSDLVALASTRARRAHDKRSLAAGAPARPGVYLFRDRADNVLYVGKARDLRARLRSYFGSERLRPAVEAAVGALHRIEWRESGSELEAALEELRLIRELRPPGNARSVRPDRYVYLRRRGGRFVVSAQAGELGPIRSRRRAELAARALGDAAGPAEALPDLRARMGRLARELRFEDAARLRDRIEALEQIAADLGRLERLRALELALVVPDARTGWSRLYLVRGGRVAVERTVAPGALGEIESAVAQARAAEPSLAPEHADELSVVDTLLRRPPPELAVCPLDAAAISALLALPRAA